MLTSGFECAETQTAGPCLPREVGNGQGPAAVRLRVLLGVVVRLEDLDQAVEGCVCTVAFRPEHHNVTV